MWSQPKSSLDLDLDLDVLVIRGIIDYWPFVSNETNGTHMIDFTDNVYFRGSVRQ